MQGSEGLRFSRRHVWVRVNGDTAEVGLSEYAQRALGVIVFVDLPLEGETVPAGAPLVTIESVKTVADLPSPVGGRVMSVNRTLIGDPKRLNRAPYETPVAVLLLDSPEQAEALMDAERYDSFCRTGRVY